MKKSNIVKVKTPIKTVKIDRDARYPLKFMVKSNTFKSSNNYLDLGTLEAYSYNWWKYVTVVKGKVVFNNYGYSMSTRCHQSQMRRLLDQLGIKIYLTINQHQSLNDTSAVLLELYRDFYKAELSKSKDRNNLIKEAKTKIAKAMDLGYTVNNKELLKVYANEVAERNERLERQRKIREARKELEHKRKEQLTALVA